MSTPLFRNLGPGFDDLSGSMHLVSIRSSILTGFLAISVALAAIFAATTEYAKKQTTTGVLVPPAGIVRIDPPQAGTITALFASNGQIVHAGDPLFTIDFRQSLEGGGTLDALLRTSLDRQDALLRDQIAREESRVASEQVRANRRVDDLTAELRSLETQRRLQEERAVIAQTRIDAVRGLRQRGLLSENDFRAREDALLAQWQDLAALESRIAAATFEYHQAELWRGMLPSKAVERLAKLQTGPADLQQRQAEVSAHGALLVRAPSDGRVTALQAARGQHVEHGKPVLAIVPEGAALEAALYVPSRAIGFVRPGQSVRLMYDAFPFQRFGTHGGVVQSVSETVLAPDEVIGPSRPKEPSYRVLVSLDRGTINAFGHEVPLQADMTVRADIILERRGLLAWVFEPPLSLKGRM